MTLRRIIGAVGIFAAAALLVHRCDDASPTRAAESPMSASSNDQRSTRRGEPPARFMPGASVPKAGLEHGPAAPPRSFRLRPAREATAEDLAVREAAWAQLVEFKAAASLSEVQMQHLLGDLSDLATLHASTTDTGLRGMSDAERIAFWTELGVELELRMETYLNAEQLAEFRFRFVAHALIAQVAWQDLLEETPP